MSSISSPVSTAPSDASTTIVPEFTLHKTFCKPTADLVLVSSDNTIFRVHRIILAEASSFFETMFSLPQPATSINLKTDTESFKHALVSDEYDGLPAIHMTESGDVVEALLRLCYPIENPHFYDVGKTGEIVAAAVKYDLTQAIAVSREELAKSIRFSALRTYFVASLHNCEDIARAAAAAVLSTKYSKHKVPPISHVDEMKTVSAAAYYWLLAYCKSGGNAQSTTGLCGHTPVYGRIARGSRSISKWELPDPDIILRSSNKTDFHLQSHALRLAAPSLGALAANCILSVSPSPSEKDTSSLPVLQLEEDDITLDHILQRIYPSVDVSENRVYVEDLMPLITAAEKYTLRQILEFALRHLESALSHSPLRVFLIACRFRDSDPKYRALACRAAKCTLGQSITSTYCDELGLVSASEYHRLLEYHDACNNAAANQSVDLEWASSSLKDVFDRPCYSKTSSVFGTVRLQVPCWMSMFFLAHLRSVMAKNPLGSVLTSANTLEGIPAVLSSNKSSMCSECQSKSLEIVTAMIKTTRRLATQVDKAVNKVEFKFSESTVSFK